MPENLLLTSKAVTPRSHEVPRQKLTGGTSSKIGHGSHFHKPSTRLKCNYGGFMNQHCHLSIETLLLENETLGDKQKQSPSKDNYLECQNLLTLLNINALLLNLLSHCFATCWGYWFEVKQPKILWCQGYLKWTHNDATLTRETRQSDLTLL